MPRALTIPLAVLSLLLAAASAWLASSEQMLYAILIGIAAGSSLIIGAAARAPLAGSAVAGVLGACVSAYLTVQHHAALAGGASVCNVNETFNCDVINTSSYSELGGVPIALLGFGFYLGVAAISALHLKGDAKFSRAPSLIYAGGIGAVLYSAFLAWASTTLGAWCLFCISLYATNLLLLVCGWLATRGRPLELGAALGGKAGDVSFVAALGVGVAAAVLGSAMTGGDGATPAPVDSADFSVFFEATSGALELSGDEPSWGKIDAPYTLIEFADYQCPYCARVFGEVKDFVEKNPDFRILFKHYPLSSSCNPNVGNAMHEQACAAAVAAVCANKQDRFWDLSRLMFKNQQNLSRADIDFMATQQVGVDADAFGACMVDPISQAKVARDISAGAAAGLNSTPTFFVRGLHPDGDIKLTKGLEGLELLVKAKASGVPLPPRPTPSAGH